MTYEAFKSAIRTQGYNMMEVAEKLGISRPTLQGRLERPETMRVSEAETLAFMLKVHISHIITK